MDDSLGDLLRLVAHSPEARPRVPLAKGTNAGDYRLLEIIGRGGFGTVYRAIHPVIGKEVAVKVLDRRSDEDCRVEERFVAEARAVNRINHGNIVDIFGFGELQSGQKFYVMELLTGETLASLLAQCGALNLQVALLILEPLADALDAAHQAGILHRDLKPANVFLHRGPGDTVIVKLLDFGVAKMLELSDGLTSKNGGTMGTPAYMAPEQSLNEPVGPATDIYALGAIAYEALTGTRPFNAANARSLITKHLFEAPPLPSSRNPLLSDSVDQLLLSMLAKSSADRPRSARDAIRALAMSATDPKQLSPGMPPRNGPSTVSIGPSAADGPEDASGLVSLLDSQQPRAVRWRPRARWPARAGKIGAAALLLGGLSLVSYAQFRTPSSAEALGAARKSTPRTTPAPRPTPAPPVVSLSNLQMLEHPQPAARSPSVWISFSNLPLSTVAYLGGQRLGAASGRLAVPRGSQPLKLRLVAPGYAAQIVNVTPNQDQVVTGSLARVASGPARARARHKAAGELEY